MILAVAAIWFLVFLPSFVKGDASKAESKPQRVKVETEVATQLSERAQMALRARRGRAILAILTATSFVVAGLASLATIADGSGLVVALASGVSTAVFAWLTARSNRNYRELLTGAVRKTIPLTAPKATRVKVEQTENNNGFQPTEVPKQTYLQTGAIEIVELAEVVSLEPKEVPIESIDEILRRRRNIG